MTWFTLTQISGAIPCTTTNAWSLFAREAVILLDDVSNVCVWTRGVFLEWKISLMV